MSTVRRDLLQQIEGDVQKQWEEAKIFESDAPAEGCEKFMCTFPYPYMNGMLHIGHAFSLTKAIFAAHFNRLLGKKVLFPFGFHCTGMPIQAAANKLKREYEIYGSPFPVFPAGRPQPVEKEGVIQIDDEGLSIAWKVPPFTGQKAIKAYHVYASEDGKDFVEVALIPTTDAQKGKVQAKVPIGGTSVYQVMTELEDGSFCPASNKSDEVTVGAAPSKDKKAAGGPPGKRVAKKTQAKTGDAAFQYEILLKLGIDPKNIEPFQEPEHWLHYFPPIGVRDLKRFATPVDFRRSFITTSINPYYDSFIRWQFGILKKADKIGFGKRPTIFSELDGQACMDHDRAEGEGVQPQEYIAIKIEVVELPPAMAKLKGNSVFLLAATLRPETMPGQTNCWILPEGTYGCYQAKAEKEVYVCSHRAARNMSFQEILEPWGKPQLIMEITGNDLMGVKVKAPTSKYDVVHVLPLLTIKMDKGTGIVTSVPSDSPDDYAAFLDLMKPGKLQHFGLKAEWVEPFKIIPIIDVEIDGEVRHLAAQYMNEKLGVQSQKDKEKLQEAHDVVYKLGFDRGIMSMGPCKGQPVKKAKIEFKGMMIKDGQAFAYSEPEKKVVSRSGDECVVAGIDQWYLKYGQVEWRKLIEDHLNSSDFCAYNDRIKESFMDAISWLKEWACSRSFGLGTRVPWDEKFVIESLSDSTVYMAYYTVSHFLHSDLEGAVPASAGIKPEDLTPSVWDYIFLNGDLPKDCKIPKDLMEKMRHEFRFWYPMDLRVSGKDLIQNHLTMSLYNHSCVWEEEPGMWPRGFFCNGWLLVNNEKMSKSKGNFFTIDEICNKYTVDAVRLAMANAGDTLEDANFEETVADNAVCDLAVLLEEMKDVMACKEALREEAPGDRFVDQWFANEMNRLLVETKGFYERMYYREALRTSYFEFTKLFKQYKDICKASKISPLRILAFRYLEWQMIILSPICPHFCEHGWSVLQKSGSVLDARFPGPTSPVDITIIAQGKYIFDKVPYEFRKLLTAASKNGPPTGAAVYVARKFPEWKESVLQILRGKHADGKLPLVKQDDLKDDKAAQAQWKELMTLLMQDASLKPFAKHVGPFAAFKRDEAAVFGPGALDAEVPYDELALVTENVEYLQDKLGLSVTVHNAEQPVADDHKDAASNAQPGMPAIYYAGVSKGGGKQSGGGNRVAGGTGPTKAVTNNSVKTISDLKVLDDHMSSRSYFDGGYRPSQADVAQFAATPSHIDADVYPHAARWHTHIAFFSAAQRARW